MYLVNIIKKFIDSFHESVPKSDIKKVDDDHHTMGIIIPVEVIQKWAKSGDIMSQIDLGDMYYKGYRVKKRLRKAFHWIKKATDQGDVGSQYTIGCMYENGHGVRRDYDKAREWYQKAYDQGHFSARDKVKGKYGSSHMGK